MPEQTDVGIEAELADQLPQNRIERTAAGNAQLQLRDLLARGRKCAEQDEVPLDRDQPSDAQQARRAVVGRRRRPSADAVVDDLEVVFDEALGLGEVPGEPARDRHVQVGEPGDEAVG